MSLKNYRKPTETVTIESADGETQDFVVSGLSAPDIGALIRTQGDLMRELYLKALAGEIKVDDIDTLVETMLDEAPLLVGLIIAFGVGEPDEFQAALDLPFGAQVRLVEATVKVTFEREGGLGKVLEIIKRAVETLGAPQPRAA